MASPSNRNARTIVDSQKVFKRLALRHRSPTSPLCFQAILGCLDISRSSAKPNASGIRDKQRSPSYQLWNRLPSPCRFSQTHLNELASVSACQSEQSQKPNLHLDLASYILLCVQDKRRPSSLVKGSKTCPGLQTFDSLSNPQSAVELDVDSFTSKTCLPAYQEA